MFYPVREPIENMKVGKKTSYEDSYGKIHWREVIEIHHKEGVVYLKDDHKYTIMLRNP